MPPDLAKRFPTIRIFTDAEKLIVHAWGGGLPQQVEYTYPLAAIESDVQLRMVVQEIMRRVFDDVSRQLRVSGVA